MEYCWFSAKPFLAALNDHSRRASAPTCSTLQDCQRLAARLGVFTGGKDAACGSAMASPSVAAAFLFQPLRSNSAPINALMAPANTLDTGLNWSACAWIFGQNPPAAPGATPLSLTGSKPFAEKASLNNPSTSPLLSQPIHPNEAKISSTPSMRSGHLRWPGEDGAE